MRPVVDSAVKAGPELSRVSEQALQMNPQTTLVCRLKAQNSLAILTSLVLVWRLMPVTLPSALAEV